MILYLPSEAADSSLFSAPDRQIYFLPNSSAEWQLILLANQAPDNKITAASLNNLFQNTNTEGLHVFPSNVPTTKQNNKCDYSY